MGRETGRSRLLRQVKIRARLFAAFGILILLLAATAGVGAWRLAELNTRVHDLATVKVRVERVVGAWLAQIRANAVRGVVLTYSDDPTLDRLLRPDFEAVSATINKLQKEIEGLNQSDEGKALLKTIAARRVQYLDVRKNVLDKKKAGDKDGATALLESSMLPALSAYVESVQGMGDYYAQAVQRDADDALRSAALGREMLAGFCLAGVLLAMLASWLITRSITKPISEAVQTARRVADGDLSEQVRPDGSDEMAQLQQALADMSGKLRQLVSEVAAGADAVADSSAQIAQGNVDLSQRTEEQASTLEETASSMQELTSTVGQNADHARQAKQLALGASQVAREGGEVVGAVVRTMSGISESSRRIAEIIGVIDGIAFQTNILALNAAVEAARAGEQGRGFAVVAAEVRNLAQRSAAAAREIKELISGSVQQVESGARLVDAAGTKMGDIVREVTKVSDLIAEIAQAGEEQSNGIEQVNVAIVQMDQGVQQNAALVEEAAASTESMKGQAANLLALVARFRLGESAVQASRPRPAEPVLAPAWAPTEPPRLAAAVPAWAVIPAAAGGPTSGQGWQEF